MVAARADVSQYIIWHRTNTEPLLRSGHPVGQQMLEIDLPALSDAVDEVVRIHWLAGSTGLLMGVLDRLRLAIQDPRWSRKMTYFQALTESVPNDNDDAAKREFNKLLPIDETETDIEILELCLSLYISTMSFSAVISLCDHILRLSDRLSVVLQYTALKASHYILIEDVQQAGKLFDQVVARARRAHEENDLDPYAGWLFALALSYLGLLKREVALFDEAIGILREQLEAEGWTPTGAARLHNQIADCHRYAERWAEAEAAYREARAQVRTSAGTVFLAEAILRQGRAQEAERELASLDPKGLDVNEYEDFAFTSAAVAVESGDRELMRKAAQRLEGFQASAPYFERRRLTLLLRVNQAITHGRSPKIVRSIRRLVSTNARRLSRYAILEPNIVGLGLNVNRALDDLADQLDGDDGTNQATAFLNGKRR